MHERDDVPTTLIVASGVVAILLALYVGAYCWAVYPYDGEALYASRWDRLYYGPHPGVELFFRPVNLVDRQLRPDVWKISP